MEAATAIQAMDDVTEQLSIQQSSGVPATHPVREAASDVAVQKAAEEKTSQVSEEEVEQIASKMNEVASIFNASLSFSVDQPTGKSVITVTDKESDTVIRQIPPKETLQLIKNMRNVMGMLLNVEI